MKGLIISFTAVELLATASATESGTHSVSCQRKRQEVQQELSRVATSTTGYNEIQQVGTETGSDLGTQGQHLQSPIL